MKKYYENYFYRNDREKENFDIKLMIFIVEFDLL